MWREPEFALVVLAGLPRGMAGVALACAAESIRAKVYSARIMLLEAEKACIYWSGYSF